MDLMNEFLTWFASQFQLAETSRKTYISSLRKLNLNSANEMTLSLIKCHETDKDKTFNTRIDALRQYKRFLLEKYKTHELIAAIDILERVKEISIPYPPYPMEASLKLLELSKGWRNQVLYIALNAGLRKDEIRRLNVEDIDFMNHWISVKHGKGKKSRRVAIADIGPLVRWKKFHDLVDIAADDIGLPWLYTRNGTRPSMSSGNLWTTLNKKLGFDVVLHSCRATYATEFYRKTKDPMTLMQQMGHSSLVTTMGYIQLFSHERANMIRQIGRLF